MTSASVLPRTRVLAVAVVAALLALVGTQLIAQRPAGNAGAATAGIVRITMTVHGMHQGQFKGDTLAGKGASSTIAVVAYQYSVTSPRDLATGQASGKRQHHPVVITHELGNSSPQFFEAIVTNEVLDKVVINFAKTDASGKLTTFYVVTLRDATVSEFKQYSSGNSVLEDISFTFRQIEQQDKTDNITVIDSWVAAD
ncbi:MAG TPA: type VI secretion system tube protein TssD [Candidatus Dormibacteraeota bacterium]|nr:type VI secretion system tube protein TssD [Candidatus Dormibacteraeota bacterium]